MSNQVSLPRTGELLDFTAVATAVRRGLASLTALVRPARSFDRAGAESYFESGLMKREFHRL
jgi:hypothetical protein